MRSPFRKVTAILGLCASSVAGAATSSGTLWFYATAEEQRWCAETQDRTARLAASSAKFASGMSAMLRYHAAILDDVMVMTESEDAYVEDSYNFDRKLRVISVVRRGHYLNSPFFNVTFARDRAGKLSVTPASVQIVARQETSLHETYFVDWPLYRNFAQFPFKGLVSFGKHVAVTHQCAMDK